MASASLSTGGEGASGEASFGLAAAWSVSLACLFFRNKAIANIFTSNAPPNTTLSRKPRAWATNRAGSRAGSEWRQLGAHRKSARAGVFERRLEVRVGLDRADEVRSEEHTSELQSRLHLVCRLLLEKKKKAIPQA